jgi:GNAT superfamily N-acetyltransferase
MAENAALFAAVVAIIGGMSVRNASLDDVEAIARVHVRSWQGAYVGLMPQEFLDRLDVSRRARMWRAIIERTEPARAAVLIAESDGEVLGFAHVAPTRDTDEDPAATGEVTAIYLDPSAWSRGVGRELMSTALARLTAAGFRQVTLWVLDTNDQARRFYAAAGFGPDGASRVDEGMGLPLREVRYRRDL